jgi:hypothetical protein
MMLEDLDTSIENPSYIFSLTLPTDLLPGTRLPNQPPEEARVMNAWAPHS